ncbi:MAG: hypothetical protein ABIP21_04795 [Acidimicrobiia bacterium]
MREPLGDVGQPAVAVVDVLHRLVRTAVGVLDEQDDRSRVSCGAYLVERVDDVADLMRPRTRLGIGHEVTPPEHCVDPPLPFARVHGSTPGRDRVRAEPFAELPVSIGLLHGQVDQRLMIKTRNECPQLEVFIDGRGAAGTSRGGRRTCDVESHRDAVLAEDAVLADRARARPRAGLAA